MNSRERVAAALDHQEPDRVPVDLGGAVVTGIHAKALDKLRRALGLEKRPVKVYEPMMMLGMVEQDVVEAVGGDVVGLHAPGTLLGYKNENWKNWTLPDGTGVLMGGGVDPQKTMPFGTPEEVAEETKQNVAVLCKGGGFVCAAVHNIQGPTPVENILAFFRSINA